MRRGIRGIALLVLICILVYRYHTMPEYKINSSISVESPAGRETLLRVTVYRNHYAEDLPGKIEQFFVDMNGEPLEGVNKIAKTIENKGFSRKGKADGKNFVRWKPLHILERCKEKRQGKTAVRHGLGIVFKL